MKKKLAPNTTEKVFAFIVEYCHQHTGIPPTWAEIVEGSELGSTSVATYHVKKLVKNGLLTYTPGDRRSIQIKGAKWTFGGAK